MWESLHCLHKRDVFVFHYEIMQVKTIQILNALLIEYMVPCNSLGMLQKQNPFKGNVNLPLCV